MNNYTIFKENKYHNKKCKYKDMIFDSIKERNEYIKLEGWQKFDIISDLRRQVPFVLIETFKLGDKTYRQTKYIADFVYKDANGKYHVIDVKSEATRKDKVYQLKKKLMAWKYGIEIEEI